jgi:hypothetical protein
MMLSVSSGAVEHAAASSHPMRLLVQVPLQQPDANGLRRREELEPMTNLEDRLTEHLERELDAWFVARVLFGGSTFLVYYHPREPCGSVNFEDGWAPYRLLPQTIEDPEWTYLLDVLAPNAFEQEMSRNRQLQQALRERGDRLDRTRIVDHVALFDEPSAALAATPGLRAAGYTVDDPRETAQGVVLEFHRSDAIDGFRPDQFLSEILALIEPYAGSYDGWGAPITR